MENFDVSTLGAQLVANVHEMSTPVIVVTLICAVLTLFFGYKLLKFWIGVAGFFLGGLLGIGIAGLMHATTPVIIIVGIVAAIIIAILAFVFYKVGVFLFTGFMGFNFITNMIMQHQEEAAWWVIAIGIVVGIIVGILGVVFLRPVVILATSASSATELAFTICPLMGIKIVWIMLIATAVFFVLGVIWQFSSTEPPRKKFKRTIIEDDIDVE